MSNDTSTNPTGLETETQHETTTFDHFDRTWTVPTRRHLSHIVKMRNEMRAGYSDYNLLVTETLLGEKQFLELCDVDPDEKALGQFVDAIASAMGVKNQGNSEPSSTSS